MIIFRRNYLSSLLLLVLCLLVFSKSQAQVGIYGFNATAGTYTPISGTTVFTGTWDDNTAVSVPLGFTFTFNNVAYTNCFVAPNGYITFTTAGSGYVPISGTGTYTGAIAAWGRDLQSQNTAPTGIVEYLSSGGIFTVQWSNARRYIATAVNAERFEMQIQLIQATGEIKIIYGNWSDAISATTANNGEVGLRGANNTDFRNLGILNGDSWSSPVPGATNNVTMFYNQSNVVTKPSNGLTYTFTLPPPCTTPVAQATSLVLTPGVVNISGSFTAASPAADKYLVVRTQGVALNTNPVNGTSYAVGAALGNGTVVSNSSATTFNSGGLIASTNYTYTIFSTNEFCSAGPTYNVTLPLTGSTTTLTSTTYTWTGATNTDYQVATNWSPARNLTDPTDILVFNNGLTNTVTNIVAQTIGRLSFSNNTIANFQASAAGALTITSDNNASTDELSIAGGSSLISDGTIAALTLAFSGSGGTGAINGNLETVTNGTITNLINFTNSVTTVGTLGTLASGGALGNAAVWTSNATSLIMNGTYIHKYTGGNGCAIPTATWNPGSDVLISGITTAAGGPNGGTGQTFFSVTYNCPNQTSNSQWSATVPANITGKLTIISTGAGQWLWASTQPYTITVKDFVQTGGIVDLGTGSGTKILNVTGVFDQSAGILKVSASGSSIVTLNFNGTAGAQNVNFFDAAPTGPVVYRITNAAGINLTGTGNLIATPNFAINGGGGIVISTLAAKPINTSLSLNYALLSSTLTYNATGSFAMTPEVFTATNGPLNLTVAIGAGNVLDMPFSRTVGGTLLMTSGDINVSVNDLTIGTSATSFGAITNTSGSIRLTTGSLTRYFATTVLPTTPGTGVGFYPLASGTSNRNVSIYFSTSTALSSGGSISVKHANVATFSAVNVNDAGYIIDRRTDAAWTLNAVGIVETGTIGIRITAGDLIPVTNFANLRAMMAASVAGTHVAGTGTYPNYQVQRTGLTLADLTTGSFHVGGANADLPQVFNAIATGDWTNSATWQSGVVPTATDAAVINNGVNVNLNAAVSAKSLVISNGGTLTVAANSLAVEDGLLNNGTILATGGTINIGPANGGSKFFTNNAMLNLSAGMLMVNGNFLTSAGSTFIQSGGDIKVDGNAAAVTANSVASGTAVVSFRTQNITLTGGQFTIIDPHASASASNTFEYTTAAGHVNSGIAHTFILGDGVSTDAGGNATNAFRINTFASSSRFAFGNLVVNTGSAINRQVTTAFSFGTLKDLTINNGGELRASALTYVGGNLLVNAGGTLTATSTIVFAQFASGIQTPATAAQSVSGTGTFRNNATTPTANFAGITVQNNNNLTFNTGGNVAFSGTVTFSAATAMPSRILMLGNILIENPGAGQSGASQANGWVVGKYQKGAAIGGILHTYIIGDANYYTPVNISGTGTNPVVTAGSIAVGTITGDHPLIGTSSINPARSVNRYYTIQAVNGITFGAGQVNATFNWNTADLDSAYTDNFIGDVNLGGNWSNPLPTVGIKTATSLQLTGLGSIIDGDYQIGGPLPTIYTFTGNGNWDLPANWSNNIIPPSILLPGDEIIIDPTGSAILNVPQTIGSGGKLTVRAGKSFVIQGNLTIN